jgi:hypothetical protein
MRHYVDSGHQEGRQGLIRNPKGALSEVGHSLFDICAMLLSSSHRNGAGGEGEEVGENRNDPTRESADAKRPEIPFPTNS